MSCIAYIYNTYAIWKTNMIKHRMKNNMGECGLQKLFTYKIKTLFEVGFDINQITLQQTLHSQSFILQSAQSLQSYTKK